VVAVSLDGVNAGEIVATDGFDKLQDGVKVRARGGASAAPAAVTDSRSSGKEAATR
jgi:hypothetical protein